MSAELKQWGELELHDGTMQYVRLQQFSSPLCNLINMLVKGHILSHNVKTKAESKSRKHFLISVSKILMPCHTKLFKWNLWQISSESVNKLHPLTFTGNAGKMFKMSFSVPYRCWMTSTFAVHTPILLFARCT